MRWMFKSKKDPSYPLDEPVRCPIICSKSFRPAVRKPQTTGISSYLHNLAFGPRIHPESDAAMEDLSSLSVGPFCRVVRENISQR